MKQGKVRLETIASYTVDHFQDGHPDEPTLRALAALVLHELWHLLGQPDVIDADLPPALRRMQEYVLSHLAAPLTVARIADVAAVSESTTQRLFRRHTGQPIGRWLLQRRLALARERLRTTNGSVAEVARSVGFDDASYFSRLFRRAYGSSPRAYAAGARLT